MSRVHPWEFLLALLGCAVGGLALWLVFHTLLMIAALFLIETLQAVPPFALYQYLLWEQKHFLIVWEVCALITLEVYSIVRKMH